MRAQIGEAVETAAIIAGSCLGSRQDTSARAARRQRLDRQPSSIAYLIAAIFKAHSSTGAGVGLKPRLSGHSVRAVDTHFSFNSGGASEVDFL